MCNPLTVLEYCVSSQTLNSVTYEDGETTTGFVRKWFKNFIVLLAVIFYSSISSARHLDAYEINAEAKL
jgi:hypothetical protein